MTRLPFDDLVACVITLLVSRGIEARVIGAAALACHGVLRGTRDLDLLVVDPAILSRSWWRPLVVPGYALDVRRGEPEDPLVGVVRIEPADEASDDALVEQLDLIVTPGAWSSAMVGRSGGVVRAGSTRIHAVTPSDLILLELYAGGPRDAWDIEALLAAAPVRAHLVDQVDDVVSALPPRCGRMWRRIVEGPA